MGLLDKLFGNKDKDAHSSTAVVDCPHAVLVPRWENVKDMGHEDKITRYMCEACHEEFAPEEAMKLRDSINERMEASWETQARETSAEESATDR